MPRSDTDRLFFSVRRQIPLVGTKNDKNDEAWERSFKDLSVEEFIYHEFVRALFSEHLPKDTLRTLENPTWNHYSKMWSNPTLHQHLRAGLGPERMRIVLDTLQSIQSLLDDCQKIAISGDPTHAWINSVGRSTQKPSFLKAAQTTESLAKFQGNVRQLSEYTSRLKRLGISAKGKKKNPGMASESSGLYQSLNFDSHEIRLLLVDLEDDEDAPIMCSLEHVSLIDPKPYIALSYCWGDPNITKNIWIRSSRTSSVHQLKITNNLDSAIRSLRKNLIPASADLSSDAPLRIWIDAICINQNDGQERSLQVRNMRHIYSLAEEVISWIGPIEGDPITTSELKNLQDVSPSLEKWNSATARDEPNFLSSFPNLLQLFHHRYWMRVWIIQEITVARTVRILYGNQELLWNDLLKFLSALETYEITSKTFQGNSLSLPIHLLKFHDRYASLVQTPISLLEALIWSRSAQATDSRDKIFALLGLCHDGPSYVPVPNYKQPIESIIADLSKSMMSLNRSLDYLFFRGVFDHGSPIEPGSDKCPSWVSDWQSLWCGANIPHLEEPHLERFQVVSQDSNPVLAGSTSNLLRVKGMLYGTVDSLTSKLSRHGQAMHLSSPGEGDLYAGPPPDLLDPWCPTPAEIIGSLITGFSGDSRQQYGIYFYRKWFASLWYRSQQPNVKIFAWRRENSSFVSKGRSLGWWAKYLSKQGYVATDDDDDDIAHLTEIMAGIVSRGLRFASLRKIIDDRVISSIAIVHPHTQKSDGVYWLYGCSMAIILRRNGVASDQESFSVIGPAYETRYPTFSGNKILDLV